MDRWYQTRSWSAALMTICCDCQIRTCTSGLIQRLELLFAGSDRNLLKFAELGVWKGATTGQLAKFLDNKGELHLFDYEDTVSELKDKLTGAKFTNVTTWGSSYRHLNSYNWNLRLSTRAP